MRDHAARRSRLKWIVSLNALVTSNTLLIVLIQRVPVVAQVRRQVATTSAGDWMLVANRDSNSVSCIDQTSRKLHGEVEVGLGPSDIVALETGVAVVACEEDSTLVVLGKTDRGWIPKDRVVTQGSPTRLCFDSASGLLYVGCRWNRTVEVFAVPTDRAGGRSPKGITRQAVIELSFEPGEILVDRDSSTVFVAGAFRAELALINGNGLTLRGVHVLPGHNVAGLAVENGMLWLSQQHLDPLAHSTRDDVHWGNMLSNRLVAYRVHDLAATVEDPSENQVASAAVLPGNATPRVKPARRLELGEPGDAAGDPGELEVVDGRAFVLLRGVRELGILDLSAPNEMQRITLPGYPVDIQLLRQSIAIADGFSDSIIWIDRASLQVKRVSLDAAGKLSKVQKGEMLFRDARLSLEGWMSCHSCHTDGHTNHQLNDNMSDGGYGSPKRVISLLGVHGTEPLAWTGKVADIETQIKRSIRQTMRGEPISSANVEAMASYIRGLRAPPPLPAESAGSGGTGDSHAEQIASGEKIFERQECNRCHAGKKMTSSDAYAIGIVDKQGNNQFNPPSLVGVSRRASLLHDSRANDLESLFLEHQHPSPEQIGAISKAELRNLVAFLKSL